MVDKKYDNNNIKYVLTETGLGMFNKSITDRQLEFVKLILSHKIFKESLKLYLKKGNTPSKNEIVEIMKKSNLYNISSNETYKRRASTIISWSNWILGLIEE